MKLLNLNCAVCLHCYHYIPLQSIICDFEAQMQKCFDKPIRNYNYTKCFTLDN